MKKIVAVVIIAVLLVLGLTSMQVNARSAYDSKTPGAQSTEKASERAAESQKDAGEKGGQKQNFKGTLVDLHNSDLTIKLDDGTTRTFTIGSGSKIKVPGGKKAQSPSEIQKGSKVMVQAITTTDPMTARHVMIIPGKPATSHHVGTVTEYAAGSKITIQPKKGDPVTFTLTPQTKILPAERAGELAVGSRVTLIYGRNVSGDAPEVRGIVVHPAGSGAEDDEPTP